GAQAGAAGGGGKKTAGKEIVDGDSPAPSGKGSYILYRNRVTRARLSSHEVAVMGFGDGEIGQVDVGGVGRRGKTGGTTATDARGVDNISRRVAVHADCPGNWWIAAVWGQHVRPRAAPQGAAPARAANRR